MILTLKQAAEATGKSKPTLLRAIQSSKMSATRDEVTGDWRVDAAELHRVYPPTSSKPLRTDAVKNGVTTDATALRREIEVRDAELEALRQEREREREDARATIDDLRRRLDNMDDERRTVLRQLTALLTDQRAKAPDVMVTPPPTLAPIITPPPAADPVPAATPTTPAAPPARPNAAPVAVKVRPVRKPPKADMSWWRKMIGSR
jgi:hypothetical protein